MGKKRGKSPQDNNAEDRSDISHGSTDDPLGKLLYHYHVSLLGLLLISGSLGLIGAGIAIYATAKQPYSPVLLMIGTGTLLIALVLLGMNIINVGRRLELRKRGIRYVEFGNATEMRWDEITDVEVNRLDNTNFGIASVNRHSRDTSSPSGLMTKTEWDIIITSDSGETIHLGRNFLRTVPDAKQLISHLKVRAGI
jgi:hypothetical protein